MLTTAPGPIREFTVSSVIVLHHTSSQQCLEDYAYKDASTVMLPTVIPDTYKDTTYYKCRRVLCRETFNTYKAAQKHQKQNPGHVCVPKPLQSRELSHEAEYPSHWSRSPESGLYGCQRQVQSTFPIRCVIESKNTVMISSLVWPRDRDQVQSRLRFSNIPTLHIIIIYTL